MQGVKGSSPHGSMHRYRLGCRCLPCRRTESLRVRAAYERACETCGGPCWGQRCSECVRRDRRRRSVQPPVFVIPPYPHPWWEHEEIEEGVLVQLGWTDGDDTIYRVTGIWDGGASLIEEKCDL